MDNFHDPRRFKTWGGEYGPYLIPRFISGSAKRCTLVYTMSTWNPYQVVVMSSDVGYPANAELPKRREIVTQPPKAPWQAGHFTHRTFLKGSETYVTTYVEKGDMDVGVAHWAFRCGKEAEFSFKIQGGLGEVVLVLDEKKPPTKPGDLAAHYRKLKAGEFGRVLEAIAGPLAFWIQPTGHGEQVAESDLLGSPSTAAGTSPKPGRAL